MEPALINETVPVVTDLDGAARVSGTRVTLDSVVAAFNMGATAEEIVYRYPTLQLSDVYAVVTYYLRQQKDVDAYLFERREAASRIRQRNLARFDMIGVRERLLARHEKMKKARDA